MADDQKGIGGLSESEESLARRLAELGLLMDAQDQFEAEIDQDFARNLRAHLMYGDESASHPAGPRNPRQSLARISKSLGVGSRGYRALIWAISAATVSVAILLGALLLERQTPGFRAPYPTKADLVFSFPAPTTIIHRLTPTLSLVHPRSGIPFAGHLQLTAPILSQVAPRVRSYRLRQPRSTVSVGRRLLAIRARPQRVSVGAAIWVEAVDGGFQSGEPLHSLAVSLETGELIYHDRRNARLQRARHPIARNQAVSIARHWLAQLGWPGHRMPLQSVGGVAGMPKLRRVVLGWIGVRRAATPAATLWVTPDRSVIEAWVWPPIDRSGSIPGRSIAAAWPDLQRGTLPLAVEGVPPRSKASGSAILRNVALVVVLAHGHGTMYLVPVYRFEGQAQLHGRTRRYVWYGLVPSALK